VTPVLGAWLLSALPATAQEPAPSPSPEPPKVEVTGFVDIYYGYNLNKVDPKLRSYDVQHNTFSLSLAEVAFAKVPTPQSRVGFRTDLDFGKAADLNAAAEPASDGKEIYKHIEQAYVSLLTGKVQWDAGKFVTPLGTEVVESQDNWNYTRSILFGYAIPFYHVGVRATYNATPKLILGAQLVNGWNNSSELSGKQDGPRQRDAQAEHEPDLDRQLHGRQGNGRLRHEPQPVRHDAHLYRDAEAQPDGELRLRQGGRRRVVGARGVREAPGEAELGARGSLRVPGRHEGRLHDHWGEGAEPDADE
jgi:hypothetical protein